MISFDIYAVSNVNSGSEQLVLNEVVLGENAGALVDFSAGVAGQLNSAFVTSYGADGGSVGFEINNFEKITLTDTADYMYVTGDVGHGLGTAFYSATYFSTSQSGLIIDPGKSGTSTWDNNLNSGNGGWSTDGIDKLQVDASSSIYLSYLDSVKDGSEVSVNISDTAVDKMNVADENKHRGYSPMRGQRELSANCA